MTLKLGSLFDGSGGFPLAGSLCGFEPVWAAEVEPYPIAVTKTQFPNMKHYGDVSTIHGWELEPVDIITFGSPCQNLSQAGNRKGLEGEASSLFFEAIRIIKEMRETTDGKYPRFAVWENVFGAFSSSKGEDFREVLRQFVEIGQGPAVMPPVPKGGWPHADVYVGDGWSLAYRTYDARYWGVPQRRRRIYLVADFGGYSAGQISFERKGLQRDFKESLRAWQRTAGHSETSTGMASSVDGARNIILNDQGGGVINVSYGVTSTLRAQDHGHPPS